MLVLGGEGTPAVFPGTLAPMEHLPCLPPRTEIGGSLYPRRGLGIKLLSKSQDMRPLSIAGQGKRHLFFDTKSGIAKLELFLSRFRARTQGTVPVADNDVTPQNRDTLSPCRSSPQMS